MKEEDKKEAEYNPDYFIDDLAELLSSLMNKVDIMKDIDFTIKQKSLIAGIVMGTANSFNRINEMLKQWGFLS